MHSGKDLQLLSFWPVLDNKCLWDDPSAPSKINEYQQGHEQNYGTGGRLPYELVRVLQVAVTGQ